MTVSGAAELIAHAKQSGVCLDLRGSGIRDECRRLHVHVATVAGPVNAQWSYAGPLTKKMSSQLQGSGPSYCRDAFGFLLLLRWLFVRVPIGVLNMLFGHDAFNFCDQVGMIRRYV